MSKRLLFLMLSCVFLLTGCGSKEKKHHLDPAALVGMTKDEVLTQAFAKCPDKIGVLHISVEETTQYGTRHFSGHEFKTPTEAKSAAVLKNSDTWQLDEIKVSRSSFPFSAMEGLVLYFTDGRVVKVGTSLTSDM